MRMHNINPDSRDKMERLYDYISGRNPEALSPEDASVLERCNFADNQLRNRYTERKVCEMIKAKFGVSDSTAYNDLQTTKYIFNSLSIEDKEYGLKLLLEINMEALQKAMTRDDLKVAGSLMDTRLKILEKIKSGSNGKDQIKQHVFLLKLNASGPGRPKGYNLSSTEDIADEDIEFISSQINEAMLPPKLSDALRI